DRLLRNGVRRSGGCLSPARRHPARQAGRRAARGQAIPRRESTHDRDRASRGDMIRFELEGGVVVLVEESHVVPLVSMSVATRTGAVFDPEGMEGASRMAVRMLQRGCQGMGATEIEMAIDSMGAELGADVLWSQTSLHGQCIGRSAREFATLFGKLLS